MNRIKSFISSNRYILLISFLVYSSVYSKAASHLIYNHDSVSRVITSVYIDENRISLGRPLREFVDYFVWAIATKPLFMFAVLFVSLMILSYQIIKLLKIENNHNKLAITLLVILFPINAIYWSYGTDVFVYIWFMSIATSSISALYNQKYLRAIILTILYLSGYQAILSFATGLIFILSVKEMYIGEFQIREFLKKVLVIALAMACYFLILNLLLIVFKQDLTSYLGANSIGILSIINAFPMMLVEAYYKFWLVLTGQHEFFSYSFLSTINAVLLIIAFIIPLKFVKQKGWYILSLLLSPIFFYTAMIITSVGLNRTDYGILTIYIFSFLSLLNTKSLLKRINLPLIFISIYIVVNIHVINTMFSIQIEKNELDSNIAQTIYSDLEHQEEFVVNSSVAFCGNLFDNPDLSWTTPTASIFGGDFLFAPMPNTFWVDSSKGLLSAKYNFELSSMFEIAETKLNIVTGTCQQSTPFYPQDGYIQINQDIYEVYLGPVSN